MAFEMAQQLLQQGEQPALVALFSAELRYNHLVRRRKMQAAEHGRLAPGWRDVMSSPVQVAAQYDRSRIYWRAQSGSSGSYVYRACLAWDFGFRRECAPCMWRRCWGVQSETTSRSLIRDRLFCFMGQEAKSLVPILDGTDWRNVSNIA